MAFVSFFMTEDIGPGPLTYIGESLSAALGLFGIGIYAVSKVNSISRRMESRFDELQARARKEEAREEE
jgi:flagellar biogenesis protein FliO